MYFVTTSHKGQGVYDNKAKEIAKLLSVPYYARKDRSLNTLCNNYNVNEFLQIDCNGPTLCNKEGDKHSFHLSMAQLRIMRLERGESDYLVDAIGAECRTFLDCTLGLGSDSIVASYALGEKGRIVGIEGCMPLAFITNYGLRHFQHESNFINAALRRIQVISITYEKYLESIPDKSIDVIYFDPMFEVPIHESPQFKSLRNYIIESKLTKKTFELACKKARRKVIVKERSFSSIFTKLGITTIIGGKYSRIAYGIYNINNE